MKGPLEIPDSVLERDASSSVLSVLWELGHNSRCVKSSRRRPAHQALILEMDCIHPEEDTCWLE